TLAVFLDRYLTDLRGLIDATMEGFVVVREGRIVQANDALCHLSGYSQSELTSQRLDELLIDERPDAATSDASRFEAALRRADGTRRLIEVAIHTVQFRGTLSQVVSMRDLTEKKEAERKIAHMARHDGLTGLPNRHLLDERLTEALERAEASEGRVALLALDLDRFKAVNDIFGHAKGDEILCRVAEILKTAVRGLDTVARMGGDEFLIVQDGITSPEDARILSRRILEAFAREMDMARDPTAVGVSIGVAVYPDDAGDAAALKHHADIALYRAKQSGRGNVRFFAASMDEEVRARRQLEHDLRLAVQRHEMSVVYQPLVTSATGEVCGYEALLRWAHPELGLIPPDSFIPIAEESGSIVHLGEWVLNEACLEAARWQGELTIAVNVSPVQFQLPSLVGVVRSALMRSGLAPQRLELEVTETVLMRDKANILSMFKQLKALGVRIVMDDFGTGYSSLNSLQSFPFDKIKIDRSFIGSVEDDCAARSIVRAIAGLGRSLNLTVVAEGVETEQQRRMVIDEGCSEAQGYYFGKPAIPAELADCPRTLGRRRA
ncbi:MAG: EAL domain-containing protein, partial [Asticcacaulis sp.]